ncbi:MAG: DUF1036 domain-containing protein [Alphaproteobacteria bacterium]|nr:DUF1036 domain-containing protein [Alphaproteobacteria bacterium]
MLKFTRIIIQTLVLVMVGGTAQAGLSICNKADVQHSFAVAFKDGESYVSKGWWNIDPGACKTVIGGDLTRRYYYFRAIATGRDFTGAEYAFCTVQASFDIVGDENCQSRGYDKSLFKKLDTGKSAKDFTLNLVMADPPAPVGEQAGTYGEPYSDFVVFQECRLRDGANFCAFHANGTKFFVYDDGRTPQRIFSILKGFDYGTPISVKGDLVGVYDTTAEVVLRDVYERGYDRSDALLEQMQGYWYAVDDPNAQFNILGAERENQYDGQIMETEYLSIQESCNEFSGAGPYLYARDEEIGEGLCYGIDSIGDFEMTLIYLPRGNFLEYRKLD